MVNFKAELSDLFSDINTPIELESKSGILKKGKYRILMIFEDNSYKFFYVKLKKSYSFSIKKKEYVIDPKSIMKGSNPLLVYFYNNPLPIGFIFEESSVKVKALYDPDEFKALPEDLKRKYGTITVDSQSLRNLLINNMFKNLYPNQGLTPKFIIIIIVVVFIILLMVLHFTGVIDVTSFFVAGTGG